MKILLESSLESQKDLIILSLDNKYQYLYFNRTHAESMLNSYGSKPQIGNCIFDYMTRKDDIENIKAHYDKALAGEGHSITEEYGTGDARYFFEVRLNPIIDGKEEIIGITSFAQNITERIEAEEKIKNIAANWQTTFDAIADAVSIIDVNYQFSSCNSSTYSFFNINADDIKTKKCYRLVHGTSEPFKDCPVERMKKSKKHETLIFNEKDKWLKVTVDPIFDDKKQLIGAVHVVSDITKRKLVEQELEKSRDTLEKTVKERTRELEDQNMKLDKAIKVFVGREKRIRDLEKKVRLMGGKVK